MNGLRTYRDRRLELGDMIRAALHVARASGDQLAEKRARELLARLAADRFQLAVVGQFSRGKTTLMNALLGGTYLPMGALPMTSVITTVRYGSRPRAVVHRRASPLPIEVPLAEVAGFVAQASARRAELQVASVQVEIPAEILRLGFEFADTPGVGSAIEINTATTRQFLPQADAVIFVTGFDSPLTETEAGFLADAARHAGRLFLVLNKRNLVSDRDAAEAAEFVRRRVRDDLGIGEPRLFALSALEALEAVVQGDRGRLSGSGLPQLRTTLDEFLTTGKTRVFLGNIADRAAGLVSGQRRDLRLGRLRLDGGPDPSAVLAAFDTRMAELGRQRSAVADKIADRIDTGLPELLAARSHAWQASMRDLIEPRAGDALAAAGNGTVRSVLEDAQGKLEKAGRDIAGGWLDRRVGEVHELLTGLAAGEIGELLETARSPGAAGAGIAGLAADEDRRELAGWSAEDVPALAVPVPEWAVPVQMPRRSRRKAGTADGEARRYLEDALTAAIVAFDERARVGFQEAARDWAPALEEVTIRWRGSYGYLTGYLSEDDDDTIELCRIQYLGDPDEWAFAIWQASTDSYAGSVLLDGRPAGHPNLALDTACTLYLAGTSDYPVQPDKPLKDLRGAALGVLLVSVEDGHDLGQCLIAADVAGEDDVGHADGLGCRIDRAEHRDHAGKQLAGHLRAADAQAVHGDVVGGDPALGDDPGGPGGQRLPDGPGQGRGDRAGDGQAVRGVAAADQGAAGVEQDIGAAQRRGDLPGRIRHHLARAGEDGGDVEFDVGGGAARAQRGNLPAGLADVGSDHDQAVPAACRAGPDLLAAKRRPRRQAGQGPHERGPGAEQERLAGPLGQQHPAGHRFQVGVLGGVDDDPRPAVHAGQQVTHPGRPAEPDVGQADAGDVAALDRPAAFLADEVFQV